MDVHSLTAWRCDCESQGAEGPDMQENRPDTVPLLVASGQLSRQSKKIGLSRITRAPDPIPFATLPWVCECERRNADYSIKGWYRGSVVHSQVR